MAKNMQQIEFNTKNFNSEYDIECAITYDKDDIRKRIVLGEPTKNYFSRWIFSKDMNAFSAIMGSNNVIDENGWVWFDKNRIVVDYHKFYFMQIKIMTRDKISGSIYSHSLSMYSFFSDVDVPIFNNIYIEFIKLNSKPNFILTLMPNKDSTIDQTKTLLFTRNSCN